VGISRAALVGGGESDGWFGLGNVWEWCVHAWVVTRGDGLGWRA
jgi:hypothetical protein